MTNLSEIATSKNRSQVLFCFARGGGVRQSTYLHATRLWLSSRDHPACCCSEPVLIANLFATTCPTPIKPNQNKLSLKCFNIMMEMFANYKTTKFDFGTNLLDDGIINWFITKQIIVLNNVCICITSGRRLDVPVLRTLYAPYGPTCVLHCLNHNCCRSVNYNKKCSSSESKYNCELLHYVASEQPGQMKHNENFDHLVLLQPTRVSHNILLLKIVYCVT
jgi:hypothetical protein